MSKLLKKQTLFLTLALAVIALCAMGTNAMAADNYSMRVDLGGLTATQAIQPNLNNNTGEAVNNGWITTVDSDGGRMGGGTLHWASHVINPDARIHSVQIRTNNGGEVRFDTNNKDRGQDAGSYLVVDFNADRLLSFFQARINVRLNNDSGGGKTPFNFRLLLRDSVNNKWYASAERAAGNVNQYWDSKEDIWYEVTTGAADLDLPVAGTVPAFSDTAFVFAATTTDIEASRITIDRVAFYITQAHVQSDAFFRRIEFNGLENGGILMPNVAGMLVADAKTSLSVVSGVTYSEVTDVSNVWPTGYVLGTDPGVGQGLNPNSPVILTVSEGPVNFWNWNGATNDPLQGTGNCVILGSTNPAVDLDPRTVITGTWPTGLNRNDILVLGNGTTADLSGATIDPRLVRIAGGSTLEVGNGGVLDLVNLDGTLYRDGVTTSTGGRSRIGHNDWALNEMAGAGTNGDGTLIVKNGGTVNFDQFNIGDASAQVSTTGRLVIEEGGIVTVNRGTTSIGTLIDGEPKGVGILELHGSSGIDFKADLQLMSAGSTIKFVSDATTFPLVQVLNHFRPLAPGVRIEVDASAYTGTEPTTITLIWAKWNALPVAGFDLAESLDITPPAGGRKADWSLKWGDIGNEGNAGGDDSVFLLYDKVDPPVFATDPATELVMGTIFMGQSSSTGTLNVINNGVAEYNITDFSFTGTEGFTLVSPSTSTLPIEVGSSDSIPFVVNFNTQLLANPSSAVGLKTGTLTIETDAPNAASTDIAVTVTIETQPAPTAIKPELWMLYED